MKTVSDYVGVIVLVIAAIIAISLLMAFPFMWCWNFVMPYLFGFKVISWGQAWCIMFMANLLFKPSFSSSNKN